MKLSLDSRLARSTDIVHSEVDGEIVMMSAENGRYYSLTDVGAAIWRRLEHPVLLSEICDDLVGRYRVERPRCEAEVLAFAEQLRDEGLVSPATRP